MNGWRFPDRNGVPSTKMALRGEEQAIILETEVRSAKLIKVKP